MFTIYQIGSLISFYMYEWSNWIPIVILVTIGINWIVYLKKSITPKGRRAVYVTLTEGCIVVYGFWVEDTTLLTVIFIATVVITGLLGKPYPPLTL